MDRRFVVGTVGLVVLLGLTARTARVQSAEPPRAPNPATTGSGPAASNSSAPSLSLPSSGPVRVVDLHVDTPWQVHFKGRPRDRQDGPVAIDRLVAGHYAAVVYPIYLPDHLHDGHPRIADADAVLATIDALVSEQDVLVPASEVVPPDRVAVVLSIEGAGAFADDIGQIDRFIRRGVRLIGPVHARDNRLGGSATGRKRGGLTRLGRRFCERVYGAGALVDVSHLSEAAFEDLRPLAKRYGAPIVASHSNARALRDHRRNLTDAQLRVIGETGGVAGLNLHEEFLGGEDLASIVAMVGHMVRVAGVEHVALGTDFDGGTAPRGLEDASKMPVLAEALKQSGLDDAAVRAIFGGNALRVLSWTAGAR